MIRCSTGIVCVAADKKRLENFGLHPATMASTDKPDQNFYVSTDFLPGVTTGVSAADRAATISAFCNASQSASTDKPDQNFYVSTDFL